MSVFRVTRSHEICAGHRVVGHEGKCRHLHGHNYVVTFVCEPEGDLDGVGRVIDFSVIKSHLCEWLESTWDHHMLLWTEDPMLDAVRAIDPTVVPVPFNPTAENLAEHLLHEVGPERLAGTGARLVAVNVQETGKCGASCSLAAPEPRPAIKLKDRVG
jgi:6-pyruvoyltetrahydropterin/6-carboxytetrahydropterin synthase